MTQSRLSHFFSTLTAACLGLAFVVGAAGDASAQSMASAGAAPMSGFGNALAVDGETVFVGEPSGVHMSGRVHAYQRGSDGTWASQAQLTASADSVGDGFGSALAVAGNRLAVGAQSSNAVYVFERGAQGWSETAQLTPADSAAGFGASVALAGDALFVGVAPSGRGRAPHPGAVYVFRPGSDGSWQRTDSLSASDLEAGSGFGSRLVASETHLLVGAPGARDGGVVVPFRYDDAAQAWTEGSALSGNGGQFGASLALDGETVLVGAPRASSATGGAHIFRYSAQDTAWAAEGRLLPYDGMQQHLFGAAVAFTGDEAWVGAPGADDRTGAIYRFTRNESGDWASSDRIAYPAAEAGNRLGQTLVASSSVAAAGLPGDDYGAGTTAFFHREGDRWMAADSPTVPPSPDVLSSITGEQRSCEDGSISQFSCEQMSLLSFLPIDQIGGERGVQVNDVWGWTDPETDREYALVGRINGTSFVDVTDPTNPVYLGSLPLTEGAKTSVWRDVKVYQNHAYIVADNAGKHGMQVFDLTKLRDVSPSERPVTFSETAHYDGIHSAHNVVINTDTGFAYVVGSSGGGQTCGGGLHMVNIQDPTSPSFAGCFSDKSTGRTGTGYTHDAQCVIYEGPDTEYQGEEICFGANETALSIANVSDKDDPTAISTGSYPDHAYVHQGWLTEDHRYFYLNDELDEINGSADRTRTLIWDVSDLDDPQLVKEFMLPERSTDHNLYVKGSTMYQSNYVSGLRMVDVSNPTEPKEIGHFDTVPFGDNGPGFGGSWSNYPFFDSGTIVVTSMDEGLFLLQKSQSGI
jgi:choice-of-anchor B domain-containing protein